MFKTLRMLRYEGYYERLFGVKTMQIKKSDDADNFHYQGASYMVIFELLKKLPEHLKNKKLIDFGSGKGRILFCAENAGFNDLTGVELDHELVKAAEENAKLYLLKRKESKINFVCQNATTYSIPNNTAVFFFFKPFSEKIMIEVEKNISAYHVKTKEVVFILYFNPKFKNVWLNAGYDIYHNEGNKRYTEALIFKR